MKFQRHTYIHIGASYSSHALIGLQIITDVVLKKRQNDKKKLETELESFEFKNMLKNAEKHGTL